MKFNYVIHCPCRLSPDPKKPLDSTVPSDDPQMRDTRMLAVLAAIVPHGRVCRFPRGHRDHCLPELDRSAPPFRSCSPIMRRFRPSPSNCLLPLPLLSFDFEGRRILARVVDVAATSKKPVHRILYVLLTFDFQRMGGQPVCAGRLIDRFYGLLRL